MKPELFFEKDGNTEIILLNRPPLNALHQALIKKLIDHLDALKKDAEVRCLILTAEGSQSFCGGIDLSQPSGEDLVQDIRTLISTLENLMIPTIACLNGSAQGLGLDLALACDLRLFADHVTISLPELNLGNIPAAGAIQRMVRLTGRAKTTELLFLGKKVKADEALLWGVCHEIHPGDLMLTRALDIGRQFKERSPLALQWAKKCLLEGENLPLRQALELDFAAYEILKNSPQRWEAWQAYQSGRRPSFS